MNTNTIINEMKKLKDLRTKQAYTLKVEFLRLVHVAEQVLQLSHFEKYTLLELDYTIVSDPMDMNDLGDERFVLKFLKNELILKYEVVEYDEDMCEPYWAKLEDLEIDELSKRLIFNNFEKLVTAIEKVNTLEKKYVDDQKKLIEGL